MAQIDIVILLLIVWGGFRGWKNGLLKEVEQDHSVKSLGRRTMLVDINENSRRFMEMRF